LTIESFRFKSVNSSILYILFLSGRRPCGCEKTFEPVCGTDGVTYDNLCVLRCKSSNDTKLAYKGPCCPRNLCPTHRSPICDNYGKIARCCDALNFLTITNLADRWSTFVFVQFQPFDMTQPCSAADCDKTKNPVCDSNNRTHKNMCLFKFFACKFNVQVEMNCPPCPLSPSDVTICDNQNMTHRSLCELARFNCQQRMRYESERVLVHIGQCHSRSLTFSLKDEQCPKNCSEERKPVCDAQGNTHKNLCHFQQSSCLIRKVFCSVETTSATTSAYECPPPACTLKGQPVCDTQGVLHENICLFVHARCLAARSGVTLSAQNEENCLRTKCQEECSSNEKPVCGSNFVTYKNLCYFNKERCKDESLSVLFYGRCEECLAKPCPPVPRDATDDHFVCDEDDFTRTVCEFQMLSCILERSISANMSIQHLGKCCEPDLSCNVGIWPPVCGTDGRTYANKCALSVEDCRNSKLQLPAIKVAHLGACEEAEADDRYNNYRQSYFAFQKLSFLNVHIAGEKYSEGIANCPNSCDNIYNPVCGSDDITYTNMCHLKLCILRTMIGLAYRGECCSMDCPNNFSPVCDDQGVTHQNLCFFGRERCIVERITGKNITIQKFDVCDDNACDKECPATYKPVCASNGETMVNECHLEKLKCFMAKKFSSGRLVKKLHDGECCPNENCGYDFSPVCDSQGHTHANPCVFRQAACLQRKTNNVTITIQYNGQCCNRQCEGQHVPICAGNRTYHNLCEFKVAQCEAERHGQVFAISYPGECCLMPKGNCEVSGKFLLIEAGACKFGRYAGSEMGALVAGVDPAHRGWDVRGSCYRGARTLKWGRCIDAKMRTLMAVGRNGFWGTGKPKLAFLPKCLRDMHRQFAALLPSNMEYTCDKVSPDGTLAKRRFAISVCCVTDHSVVDLFPLVVQRSISKKS
uniref:Kazal-like domain-containing protein n=1 Tax=Haemonchus placei TaxID=6290 RepID=A0A158QMD5_HAEPC